MIRVPARPIRNRKCAGNVGVGPIAIAQLRIIIRVVAVIDRGALKRISWGRMEARGTGPLQVATSGLYRLNSIGVGLDPQVDATRTYITDPQRRARSQLTFDV